MPGARQLLCKQTQTDRHKFSFWKVDTLIFRTDSRGEKELIHFDDQCWQERKRRKNKQRRWSERIKRSYSTLTLHFYSRVINKRYSLTILSNYFDEWLTAEAEQLSTWAQSSSSIFFAFDHHQAVVTGWPLLLFLSFTHPGNSNSLCLSAERAAAAKVFARCRWHKTNSMGDHASYSGQLSLIERAGHSFGAGAAFHILEQSKRKKRKAVCSWACCDMLERRRGTHQIPDRQTNTHTGQHLRCVQTLWTHTVLHRPTDWPGKHLSKWSMNKLN